MPTRKLAMVSMGKRKMAVARAVVKPGQGEVKINNVPLEVYMPEVARGKIMEPLMLAGDLVKQVNINVETKGGGFMGQADAARISIARGLVNWFKSAKLKRALLNYDKLILAGDSRVKEMKKFGGRGARTRKQKSYR